MRDIGLFGSMLGAAFALFALMACQPKSESETVPESAPIRVTDAWMRSVPPGAAMGAVYVRIQNDSERDYLLNHLATPVAGSVSVHRTVYDEGVTRMRQVRHLRVPAGETLVMAPGGYHIMLMDMHEMPAAGGEFPLQLDFDGGQSLTAQVLVKPIR